jgi:hypothetical protein
MLLRFRFSSLGCGSLVTTCYLIRQAKTNTMALMTLIKEQYNPQVPDELKPKE